MTDRYIALFSDGIKLTADKFIDDGLPVDMFFSITGRWPVTVNQYGTWTQDDPTVAFRDVTNPREYSEPDVFNLVLTPPFA